MMKGGVRPLDGLGVAERSGQLVVGAVEVERLGLRPQAPDDRARFGEALDGIGEVEVSQAVRRVLATGRRGAGPRAHADAEIEPAAGHDVDGRGDLGEHRGRPEPIAGHQQPQAQMLGLSGKGREERPALEDRAVRVTTDRQEVVEQPRMQTQRRNGEGARMIQDRTGDPPRRGHVPISTGLGRMAAMKINLPDRLSDDRVCLRPMVASDAAAYAAAFRDDPDLGRLLGVEQDPDEQTVRERIEAEDSAGDDRRFSSRDRRSDQRRVLGRGHRAFAARTHRRGEVGFWVVRDSAGRVLDRALSRDLVLAFEELELCGWR